MHDVSSAELCFCLVVCRLCISALRRYGQWSFIFWSYLMGPAVLLECHDACDFPCIRWFVISNPLFTSAPHLSLPPLMSLCFRRKKTNLATRKLVLSLPDGVTLTVVMDCCHSGSILDLPYNLKADEGTITAVEAGEMSSTISPNPGFNMEKASAD